MKIHTEISNVEYWYDPSCRCWFAMRIDEEGFQSGDSENAYTRPEIEIIARRMSAEGPFPIA